MLVRHMGKGASVGFLVLLLGSCSIWDKYNASFKKNSSDEGKDPVETPGAEVSESDDHYSARIADNTRDISLAPSTGDLRGASVLVPAGSLAVGTEVSMAAGATFATENTLAELAVAGNPETNGVGPAVMVSGSSAAQAPMTISLPFPAEAGLMENSRDLELLVVFYRLNLPDGKTRTGIMIRKELDVQAGSIKFQSQYFGTFQAAFLTIRVELKPVDIESTVTTLSKRAVSTLPPIEWTIAATAGADRAAELTYAAKGMGDLAACVIVADLDKAYPFDVRVRVTSIGAFTQRALSEARHELFFRVSCVDKAGRDSGLSPWATVIIPDRAGTTSTTSTTSGSTTTVNVDGGITPSVITFLKANEATDGFVNTAEQSSALPLFSLTARDYAAISYSDLLDHTPSVTCDDTVVYNQGGVPAAGSLPPLDDEYVVCARLTGTTGEQVYAKSPVVIRDTMVPTISMFALANQAADGKINASESSSTSMLASLVGSGYSEDDFALIDTATTCDQNVTFDLPAIPFISSLTGEFTKKLCVRLTDAAQNHFFQATGPVQRDTSAPAAFVIVNPSNAATLYDDTPSFSWNQSDPTGVTYAVRVGSADTCSDTGDDVTLTSATGLSGLTYTVTPALIYGNTYYLCVVATDDVGNATASVSRQFTLQSPPFACDVGDYAGTCIVNTPKSMPPNSVVNITGSLTLSANLSVSSSPFLATLNIGGDLVIASGASLTGNVTVSATNIILNGTAKISADGLGNAGGTATSGTATPGSGAGGGNSVANQAGSGGAYGGFGGAAAALGGLTQSNTYGDPGDPTALGSGGGGGYSAGQGSENGGAGGGAINLVVSGALNFAGGSGLVSAKGANATKNAGGGSGGSIKIAAGQIANAGTAMIVASGGSGGTASPVGGGGGGGRVRVQSGNYSPVIINVVGGAAGGTLGGSGGYGSYTQSISGSICDSGTNAVGQTCTISSLRYAGDGQSIEILGSLVLSTASGKIVAASPNSGFVLKVAEQFTVDNGVTFAPAGTATPNVHLRAKNVLKELHAGTMTVNGSMVGNFPLISTRTLTMGGTGVISADGWGYNGAVLANSGGQGTGGGSNGSTAANGASHCGMGQGGGTTYDTDGFTFDYGSGGGVGSTVTTAGSGGGIIRIIAPQSVTLVSGSAIRANGGDATGGTFSAGGGAGGAIWVQTGTLTKPVGSEIAVNGGKAAYWPANYYGGGGGGGCMTIIRKAISGAGTTSISGGPGQSSGYGGTGIVYDRDLTSAGAVSIAFLTNATYSAAAGAAALHSACDSEATAAGWPNSGGVTWKALISTSTTDAFNLLATERIVSSRGVTIAEDKSDMFDGALVSPIKYSASGGGVTSGNLVLTGSDSSGYFSSSDSCSSYSSTAGNTWAGNGEQSGSAWIVDSSVPCSNAFRLYCISN